MRWPWGRRRRPLWGAAAWTLLCALSLCGPRSWAAVPGDSESLRVSPAAQPRGNVTQICTAPGEPGQLYHGWSWPEGVHQAWRSDLGRAAAQPRGLLCVAEVARCGCPGLCQALLEDSPIHPGQTGAPHSPVLGGMWGLQNWQREPG